MSFFRKELIYVLILLLGSISWGLTIAYWSPCKISMSLSLKYSNKIGTLFNFLAPFACIFGGPFINLFINKLGLNKSVFITAVFMYISWILMAFTKSNFYCLALITRIFLGFAIGSFSTIIPPYIADLSPDDVIGAYGMLHQLGISVGVLLCYILGIWLEWRKITLVSSIPAGLLSILIWFVPEAQAVTKENEETVFQKKYVNQILIALALVFFKQFAGTNAFLSNLNGIFNKSQIDIKSSIASFIVGLTGVVAVLITYIIIKLCRRKLTWYISTLGQAFVLALCACNSKWNWSPVLPILCLFLDYFLFLIGLVPISWSYVHELFNESVRSSATSLITAVNWLFGTVLFLLWDVMESGLGLSWSFAIFTIIMILSFIFGLFALPKSLDVEDMQGEYSGKSNSNNQNMHSKLLNQNLI